MFRLVKDKRRIANLTDDQIGLRTVSPAAFAVTAFSTGRDYPVPTGGGVIKLVLTFSGKTIGPFKWCLQRIRATEMVLNHLRVCQNERLKNRPVNTQVFFVNVENYLNEIIRTLPEPGNMLYIVACFSPT